MDPFIILVFIVVCLLLLLQWSTRSRLRENLHLTRDIHAEIIKKKAEDGEKVDSHVERNKKEGEELHEVIQNKQK